MTDFHVLTGPRGRVDIPAVRKIGLGDLGAALRLGWIDFWRKPSHLVFLGLIYPFAGAAIALWTSGVNAWPLLYPLISGFALLGPIAALPIYEMSRRHEHGVETTWRSAFGVLRSPAMPSILAVGFYLLTVFTVWLLVAQSLYEQFFGLGVPADLTLFLNQIATTVPGQSLMIWGNLVGFLFAALVLASAVVTVPLLVDRDVGAAIAIYTSIRVTLRNPVTIAAWGLIVAALLLVGSLPLLVGLAIVVPVLGHATWHLYRRAVAPAAE